MAYLFEIEDSLVYPNRETLLIYPFNEIWERDTSKKKVYAIEDFTYIEFVSSFKKSNPYRQYSESLKKTVVKKDVISRKEWVEDDLIKKAIEKIKVFQREASATYSYYIAAKTAAESMKSFFMTPNLLSLENPKTLMPIYKPKDITSALNDTEKVLNNLKSLEKKVDEELFEEVKNRSDKQVSPFADPDSL